MKEFPEVHRWFTSGLVFKTPEAELQCYKKLQSVVEEHGVEIAIEPGDGANHLSGSFDFTLFDDRFADIVCGYVEKNWRIKCILSDKDGYFSGWVQEYHPSGICIDGINISSVFEEGFE